MFSNDGGTIMIGSPIKTGVVAAMGLVLLVSQGCSMKWLQSDGETGAGSAQNGANPNFPGMAPGGSGKGLSGFSQNPSEERLGTSGDIASLSSSGMTARQRAEITKEEKAAIEAGLLDVFFGYDQWMLSDAGMEALSHDAQWLKDHPGAVMKVEGHCDERGTADYNVVLGDKRAKAARSYLIESGVGPKQVAIVSYGKARPFCTDPAESCYQQNRRGHVLLNVKK
jgi:peptidoglycan-associated lipoprotein